MMSKKVAREISSQILKTDRSILLLGPRQTGKSTLIQALEPELKINLARQNEFLRYSSQIDLFTDQIESSKAKTIFVDEIQRIPELLNSIQALIDDAKDVRPLRFFLTGSSARKLKRGGANLLPGRIFTYHLGGFCARELSYQVDAQRALKFGLMPEPYLSDDPEFSIKFLMDYSATYLKEEIQAEALARDIQGFARFLVTMAQAAGSVLDYSKLAKKAKVARSSVVRFTEILEDTLVAYRVPPFEKAEKADSIRHSKLYFFDVGVLNGLLENFSVSVDRIGTLFEHFFINQLKNSAYAQDLPIKIEFFRTRHGLEVDFIVTLKEKTWAIEVKAGDVSSSDLGGLKGFREYYPQVDRCVAVSLRETRRVTDGILICDWLTLLQEMGL
jgi:predicted AAA+ superfamily ATPase